METVRSHRNPQVAGAARLHRRGERARTGRTLIEGPNLLREAIDAGVDPEIVFGLSEDTQTIEICATNHIEFGAVDERGLGRLAGTRNPRGPVAVISIPPDESKSSKHLLVSWGVSDPGNVGNLIRTAAAFGWDYGYTPNSADPWAPKVMRAGVGGHFRLAVSRVSSVEILEGRGYATVATVVEGGSDINDIEDARYAVLVGDEGSGLPEDVASRCRHKATVPMPGGIESLNVAVAASIIVYALST